MLVLSLPTIVFAVANSMTVSTRTAATRCTFSMAFSHTRSHYKSRYDPCTSICLQDPQFAPECKDESTPGTSTFSQEEMNQVGTLKRQSLGVELEQSMTRACQVAEELTTSNPDNPCANIFSTWAVGGCSSFYSRLFEVGGILV